MDLVIFFTFAVDIKSITVVVNVGTIISGGSIAVIILIVLFIVEMN